MATEGGLLPLDAMVALYLTDLDKGKGDIYMRMAAAKFRREMQMATGTPAYMTVLNTRMAAQMAGPLSEEFNHTRHIPLAMRPSAQAPRRHGTSRNLPPSGLRKQCR